MGLGKGLMKGLKGLGKKASSLGSKMKARAAGGYKRLGGQEKLLGGTTKSDASRAFAPIKAKAKSLGSKIRGGGGKKTGFSNFDGPYKPSKDDGFGSVLGKNAKKGGGGKKTGFSNFDSGYTRSKDDGFSTTADFDSIFPKASRTQRASMGARNMKARASDAMQSAKGRINEYRTGKKMGGGGKKSSAPDDFSTTMDFDSVFPKASRGQRARMSLDMAKGRARDIANSAKAKYNKYKNGKSGKAGMGSNGNTRYDAL
jgi:hypothetical protein